MLADFWRYIASQNDWSDVSKSQTFMRTISGVWKPYALVGNSCVSHIEVNFIIALRTHLARQKVLKWLRYDFFDWLCQDICLCWLCRVYGYTSATHFSPHFHEKIRRYDLHQIPRMTRFGWHSWSKRILFAFEKLAQGTFLIKNRMFEWHSSKRHQPQNHARIHTNDQERAYVHMCIVHARTCFTLAHLGSCTFVAPQQVSQRNLSPA